LLYRERDEDKRQAFLHQIAKILKSEVLYVDESGVDEFAYREYGWAPKGDKAYGEISGKRYARESFIAAKSDSKIIAPFCFTGTCDTDLFNAWLENMLKPCLCPGQVIVMDNASFHKSEKTKSIIESAKCTLLFLPPYSPDLNPIERVWANLKKKIKQIVHEFETLGEAIDYAFGQY
jgi:transposase